MKKFLCAYVFAGLALLSIGAAAQTAPTTGATSTTTTVPVSLSPRVFSLADCTANTQVSLQYVPNSFNYFIVAPVPAGMVPDANGIVSNISCPGGGSAGATSITSTEQTPFPGLTYQATIPSSTLLASVCAQQQSSSNSQGITPPFYAICLYSGTTSIPNVVPVFTVNLASLTITGNASSIAPDDGQIAFTVTPGASFTSGVVIQTCYGPTSSYTPVSDAGACASPNMTNTSAPSNANPVNITISGLTNSTQYTFQVRAYMPGSNNSVPAASSLGTLLTAWQPVFTATPQPLLSPLQVSDMATNPFSMNCSQTSSPDAWILLVALAIMLTARRRFTKTASRALPTTLLIAVACFSQASFADLGQVNIGLGAGPYLPNISKSTTSSGAPANNIYGCFFKNSWLPLIGLDVDVHLFDAFGSLQIGVNAGYAYASGQAQSQASDKGTFKCGQPIAGTSASMHIFQLRPQLTYIFDPYVTQFPLAPYVRAGIIARGYYFTYKGSADTRGQNNVPAQKPLGVIFGWDAAIGALFMLDFFETKLANSARAEGIFDHTYLKAELAYSVVDNFGSNGLNLSSRFRYEYDIPLQAMFGIVVELP